MKINSYYYSILLTNKYYRFADMHVRTKAVEWLAELNDDDVCDILPQLVQVQLMRSCSVQKYDYKILFQTLQFDCYPCSAMSEFLLTRAIVSPQICHFLYWNLRLLQTSDIKLKSYSEMMLRALKSLVGTVRCMEFTSQVQNCTYNNYPSCMHSQGVKQSFCPSVLLLAMCFLFLLVLSFFFYVQDQ